MRGEAFYTQIVQEFANILGLLRGPGVVGREELDHFVAHFSHGANGARQVLFELIADGVEFETDWNLLGAEGKGRRGGQAE